MKIKRVLVTGGCGFIGSHYVSHLLKTYPELQVTNLDKLTYAAHPDMPKYLEGIAPDRYTFVQEDILSDNAAKLVSEGSFDAIVNFAAESHVDRSILNPMEFVQTNVNGVMNLLSAARKHKDLRFVQVSTDEVYGSLAPDARTSLEGDHLDPNSPYAASKAAADLLIGSCERTFKQNILITRCTNNFGPFQFPEKLLPLVIANALEDKNIPVYGDGKQIRDWIYVGDHCWGIDLVMRSGKSGEVYNISSSNERPNIDVIQKVLSILGKPASLITYVGDRPAHDRRYGLNPGKIQKELGWKPLLSFEQALRNTVDWYVQNQDWWKKLRDKDFYRYYDANYKGKFARKEANH